MIMDIATHIFTILKQPDRKYLTQEDFKPLLRELLSSHPGLEFLQNTPEFQDRYGHWKRRGQSSCYDPLCVEIFTRMVKLVLMVVPNYLKSTYASYPMLICLLYV
ncbi:hypothetical protein KSP40_PGU012376 [Platanthera guangdongensis]|uniref:PP2A regulatory subunit B'' EF-hand domain-containing protein n=1 Tax=Platanthera guangdongensis TaxID=2320717 RepID=A0ABR2MWG6_9ASPA